MRRALVLLVLSVTACEGSFVRPENLGLQVQIQKSYEARDACLKRHAAADVASLADQTTTAQAVAMACQAETARLVAAANTDGDAKVTASIRQDTEFRAMKYVLQAQGQAQRAGSAAGSAYVDSARRPDSRTTEPTVVHSAAAPSTGP